jgi:hypothetical protein
MIPPSIQIIAPGRAHAIYVDRIAHVHLLPEYPQTHENGYAYLITLDGMDENSIQNLKEDVSYLYQFLTGY